MDRNVSPDPEIIALQNWEDDHFDWMVVDDEGAMTDQPGTSATQAVELKVRHVETGEILTGVGPDVFAALRSVTDQIDG